MNSKIHIIVRLTTLVRSLLIIGLFLPQLSLAKDYTVKTVPNIHLTDLNSYVSNPDGIISTENVSTINELLKTLEDSLGIEVAVVAIESIGDNDARMFATDLFKHWGIGKKTKDNGLLIQLVTEPSQRSIVFETGYGLEGTLPDAICYRLQQQYMIPDMREGNYSEGMLKGISAVKSYLMASDYERSEIIDLSSNNDSVPSIFYLLLLFPFLLIFFTIINSFIKKRPRICPKCGNKSLIYLRQDIVTRATYTSEGVVEDIYRCKNCGYTEKKRKTVDRLRRSEGGGPIIFGGGGSFGGGSIGRGGGSWGGGRSGGGGSISRF